MDRRGYHSIDRLKEKEWRMEVADVPPSAERFVQPDKHWHCGKGKLGETAERRGGARMGLSDSYDETETEIGIQASGR